MLFTNLPKVAKPVFFCFLVIVCGLGVLLILTRTWRHRGPVENDRVYYRSWIHAHGLNGADALGLQLSLTVIIQSLMVFFILAILFRIIKTFRDPDVLANEAFKPLVAGIMAFWVMFALGTLFYCSIISLDVIVAMRCIDEHNITYWDVERQRRRDGYYRDLVDNDYSNRATENTPLLKPELPPFRRVDETTSEYSSSGSSSGWGSAYGTLIPTPLGSFRSASSITIGSPDKDFSSNTAEAGED